MRQALAPCRWLPALAALCCAACSGGGGLHPVHGQVLFKGKPAQGALVVFRPKGDDSLTAVPATGETREDGTFTLFTGPNEGAAAGEYSVTITWPEEAPVPKDGPRIRMDAPPSPPDRLKGHYAKPDKAFTVQVKPGKNQLEPFNLKLD
jgi:hypothetical protein